MTDQWQDLNGHPAYEMHVNYPYLVRHKRTRHIVKEWLNTNDYVRLTLNGRNYYKHRLVAQQFIPNPDNLPQVDHKNKDRTDYHVTNLRWTTRSDNGRNKTGRGNIIYEYLEEDDLPDDLIVVDDYGVHQFEDYYYSESMDAFLFYNGVNYRLLHVNRKRNGSAFVCCRDLEGANVQIFYSKFKKIYGLN